MWGGDGFGDGFQNVAQKANPQNFICSAIFGMMICIGGLGLGGWNEYRHVATARTITLGRDFHKPVACEPRDPAMNGKLVHMSCPLTGQEVLGESTSGVPPGTRGVRLTSYTEAYQWVQERQGEDRNDERATYVWVRRWMAGYDEGLGPGGVSGQERTQNPSLSSRTWYSSAQQLGSATIDNVEQLYVGAFDFPDGLYSWVLTSTSVMPTCATTAAVPCPNGVFAQGEYLYYKYDYGSGPGGDQVGDMRKTFTLSNADFASLLAQQEPGGKLVPWISPYDEDYTIFMADNTEMTADELFEAAEDQNYALTWCLRVFTLIFTIFGIFCIFSPISQLAELVPCFGPMLAGLINTIICAVACAAGFACWVVVVGCTWAIYRPWIGIPLLLTAMAITACLCFAGVSNAKKNQGKMNQGGGGVPMNVTDPGFGFNNGGGGFNNGGGGFNNGGGGGGFAPPAPGMNFCPQCGQMKPAEVPVCNNCTGGM